jgi:hypothetical protein
MNENQRKLANERALASSKAKVILRKRHLSEYQSIYVEELAKLGIDTRYKTQQERIAELLQAIKILKGE